MLRLVWGIALAGVALKLVTLRLPRWVSTALYLGMGWLLVLFAPHLLRSLSPAALVCLGIGALLYTVGAVIYATERPRLWPGRFGSHDLWHLFVLGGTACHLMMMRALV